MGQPWLLGEISAKLDGAEYFKPTLAQQAEGLCEQIEDSMSLYGVSLGLRIVRKHISAHIDKVALPFSNSDRRALRANLCRIEDATQLLTELQALYAGDSERVAA